MAYVPVIDYGVDIRPGGKKLVGSVAFTSSANTFSILDVKRRIKKLREYRFLHFSLSAGLGCLSLFCFHSRDDSLSWIAATLFLFSAR